MEQMLSLSPACPTAHEPSAMSHPNSLRPGSSARHRRARSRPAGHQVWCVGGAILDTLLAGAPAPCRSRRPTSTLPTSARPEQVQALFGLKRTGGRGSASRHHRCWIRRSRVLHEVTTFRPRRDHRRPPGRRGRIRGVAWRRTWARSRLHHQRHRLSPLRHEWQRPLQRRPPHLERRTVRVRRLAATPAEAASGGLPPESFAAVVRFAARFGFRRSIPAHLGRRPGRGGPGAWPTSADRSGCAD
jgi:hypothetical protein